MSVVYKTKRGFVKEVTDGSRARFEVWFNDTCVNYFFDLDTAKARLASTEEDPTDLYKKVENERVKALPRVHSRVKWNDKQYGNVFAWVYGSWDSADNKFFVRRFSDVAWGSEAGLERRIKHLQPESTLHGYLSPDSLRTWSYGPVREYTPNFELIMPESTTRPHVFQWSSATNSDGREGEFWASVMSMIEDLTDMHTEFYVGITNSLSQRSRAHNSRFSHMVVLAVSPNRSRIAASEAALIGMSRRDPRLRNLILNEPAHLGGESIDDASRKQGSDGNHYLYVCFKVRPAIPLDFDCLRIRDEF